MVTGTEVSISSSLSVSFMFCEYLLVVLGIVQCMVVDTRFVSEGVCVLKGK